MGTSVSEVERAMGKEAIEVTVVSFMEGCVRQEKYLNCILKNHFGCWPKTRLYKPEMKYRDVLGGDRNISFNQEMKVAWTEWLVA